MHIKLWGSQQNSVPCSTNKLNGAVFLSAENKTASLK